MGPWGRAAAAVLALALGLAGAGGAAPAGRFIVVASTTSTENSGLFGHILPRFAASTGIEARVVAVGTGQAIRIAKRGDADVLLVHDTAAEEAFVEAGYGTERLDVMYNDFVVVGPEGDPAGAAAAATAAQAFARIARARAPFVSRGDDSGTHKAEGRIWAAAGIDAVAHSGTWYREAGAGMGATLNTAAMLGAYTLADRGTWLAFRNRMDLRILFEGDPLLFNRYGVVLLDPARFPHVKAEAARAFARWLVSPEGQDAIASFRIAGEQAFFPNAEAPGT